MITISVLPTPNFYYPLDYNSPVCLTQDLPPEQDADILLLGCCDARNILFTCFADGARKIDVTCCDIEPGIHARNILLYTLLIDDEANHNIERIWNIYYNWKIDKTSLELLETQIQKLLTLSESVDKWHSSVYGASIRFCDEHSLSSVRSFWLGFTSQGLLSSQKEKRLSQMQSAIQRAKTYREKKIGKQLGVDMTGLRSMLPELYANAAIDINNLINYWWDCGAVPSNSASMKPEDLNPTFLYSPNQKLTLHFNLSPFHGIAMRTAYIPVSDRFAFCLKNKGSSSADYLVNCVKSHFKLWASAFRKAVRNKSVIRIFAGDTLNFCLTLRNCHLTGTTSSNLFRHMWTSRPLILHHSDYGRNNNTAPLIFDVINTSYLADYVGTLNLLALGSSLLKHHPCCVLYMASLAHWNQSLGSRLLSLFGVEVNSLSRLLGLGLADMFTNDGEENSISRKLVEKGCSSMRPITLAPLRLRWTRPREREFIRIQADELTKFLIKIHDALFTQEDFASWPKPPPRGEASAQTRERSRLLNTPYNRASFAFLLSILKQNVVTNWDECMNSMYDKIFANNPSSSLQLISAQDLILNMHNFGVDSRGRFTRPTHVDVRSAVLASILPLDNDLPDQLCVTFRVRRKHLGFLTEKDPLEIGCPAILGHIEGGDTHRFHGARWSNFFSSVQVVFGKWHPQSKEGHLYPFIEEDSAQLSGTSDMFVSFMVPTSMLLFCKESVPLVKCGLACNQANFTFFGKEIGGDLSMASSEMTSEDVFITRFMPGMSGLPTFPPADQPNNTTPVGNTVHLSPDGLQINSLVKRIYMDSESAKSLALKSSAVKIKFKSPLSAVISIAESVELKVVLPIPVSTSKYKVGIARKSSYIEIESPVYDRSEEKSEDILLYYSLVKTPRGTVVLAPWAERRVNLDAVPRVDMTNIDAISWLSPHLDLMFSMHKVYFCNSKTAQDIRTELQNILLTCFTKYTELQGGQTVVFGLSTSKGIQTLIFPSCFRLELGISTVVLDCALVPLTNALISGSREGEFFQDLCDSSSGAFHQIEVSEAVSRAFKTMMPGLIERCRTWEHSAQCEYSIAGEIPLPQGLDNDGDPFICSCGIGKFPTRNFVDDPSEMFSNLNYILKRYATRIAFLPVFTLPLNDGCKDPVSEVSRSPSSGSRAQTQAKCQKCGSHSRRNVQDQQQSLFSCSKCKIVKYCSADCQKADWKEHKRLCKSV